MNPTRILCADWGKAANKRAVFVADAADRPIVRRLSHPGWTLSSLLQEADARPGRTRMAPWTCLSACHSLT